MQSIYRGDFMKKTKSLSILTILALLTLSAGYMTYTMASQHTDDLALTTAVGVILILLMYGALLFKQFTFVNQINEKDNNQIILDSILSSIEEMEKEAIMQTPFPSDIDEEDNKEEITSPDLFEINYGRNNDSNWTTQTSIQRN